MNLIPHGPHIFYMPQYLKTKLCQHLSLRAPSKEQEPNGSYSNPSIKGTLADRESELSQGILKRHCFV